MGNETTCTVRFGKQKSTGKALLETNEVIFRGDFRLKVPFVSLKSAKAVNGELRLDTADGPAIFELGEQAAKWCDKILHPKSRIEKLGVKANASVALLGEFDREFLAELREVTKNAVKGKLGSQPDWIFLEARQKSELGQMAKLAKQMRRDGAIWVVYPKGKKDLTESDVLAAGRRAGLRDVKVVGFSLTHTALKFVVPLANR